MLLGFYLFLAGLEVVLNADLSVAGAISFQSKICVCFRRVFSSFFPCFSMRVFQIFLFRFVFKVFFLDLIWWCFLRWREVLEIARREALEYVSRHGISPTLRGLFYILVSKNVIPNTRSAYKVLSDVVSRGRYVGVFPWDLIRDESREFRWGESGSSVSDAERSLEMLSRMSEEDKKKLLRDYLLSLYGVRINKWEGQRYSVLVVVEKEALFDVVDKIANVDLRWDVSVTASRGFESATLIKSVGDWIVRMRGRGRIPVVLLIFDWDPSGEYAGALDFAFRSLLVVEDYRERLLEEWEKARDVDRKEEIVRRLSEKNQVVFEKIMLTWDQVQRFKLPPEPQDEEVKKKLLRDSRARMFIEKYGFLGQVEIDAMFALYYDEARRIIDESIRRYFDEKVYEDVRRKEEELREKLEKIIS